MGLNPAFLPEDVEALAAAAFRICSGDRCVGGGVSLRCGERVLGGGMDMSGRLGRDAGGMS